MLIRLNRSGKPTDSEAEIQSGHQGRDGRRRIIRTSLYIGMFLGAINEYRLWKEAEGRSATVASCRQVLQKEGRSYLSDRDAECLRRGEAGSSIGESVIARLETRDDLREYGEEQGRLSLHVDVGRLGVFTITSGSGLAIAGLWHTSRQNRAIEEQLAPSEELAG